MWERQAPDTKGCFWMQVEECSKGASCLTERLMLGWVGKLLGSKRLPLDAGKIQWAECNERYNGAKPKLSHGIQISQ